MLELLWFVVLAIVLGFKHSYDADHILAVSNILRKVGTLNNALGVSASWALGHMITAAIITFILYLFRESILTYVLPYFEMVVGVVLIFLGVISLGDAFVFHEHEHRHGKTEHSHPHLHVFKEQKHAHKHMFGIGIIHGLASNDELLLLFTASLGITTLGGMLLGMVFFSLGVVLGMLVFAAIFSYSVLRLKNFYRYVAFGTGILGIAYGLIMIL